MEAYEMTYILESGKGTTKKIKARHRYEAYTKFIKTIPLNELEFVKAILCHPITIKGEMNK